MKWSYLSGGGVLYVFNIFYGGLLEAVLVLQKQKGYARCVDVSEFLGVTKPSVSRAVKELSKKKCLLKKTMAHSLWQSKDRVLRNKFMRNTDFSQNSLLKQAFPVILRKPTPAGWSMLSAKQVLRGWKRLQHRNRNKFNSSILLPVQREKKKTLQGRWFCVPVKWWRFWSTFQVRRFFLHERTFAG